MTSNEPNAAAAESAIQQIGTEFRRLRTLRGERIEDIAAYLDIKSTYLFAIEQGDLSIVSSRREAKSILRDYADYLGLDGEGIIGPMDPIIASLDRDKAPMEPEKTRWLDRTSAIILGTSVVLGVLVGWSWIGDVEQFDLMTPPVTASSLDGDAADIEAAADALLADDPLEGVDTDTDAASPDLPGDALSGEAAEAADALLAELKIALGEETVPGSEGDAAPAPGTGGDRSSAGEALEKEADPANVLAALVAERGDGAHIYEAENTDARVIVRALDDVSVQVASRSRDYVWTKTMKPREMMLVPNRDDLELWTGDAAGIEVLLDGAILPPLGPDGTVISGLSLAASSLEALSGVVADDEGGAKPTF